MYMENQNNPTNRKVNDSIIRALAKAFDIDWDMAFTELSIQGLCMGDVISLSTLNAYLWLKGIHSHIIPCANPDCYSVKDFCKDNNKGIYIVSNGDYTIPIVDGNYYDISDTGNENVFIFWRVK